MDIYISGMEMPESDMKNIMILADGRVFQFSGYGSPRPLGTAVLVPEHGDLIERDALREEVKKHATPSDAWVFSFIRTAPAVIPDTKHENRKIR